MMTLLESSTTCWTIMIRDYGVVGTVSASASIALVLLLAIAMHKAFLSSNFGYGGNDDDDDSAAASKRRHAHNNASTAADKKRRRRKGHHHTKQHVGSRGGGGGRIKGSSTISGGGSSSLGSSPSMLCPRLPKVEEVSSDGAACDNSSRSSCGNAIPNLEMEDGGASQNPSTADKEDHNMCDPCLSVSQEEEGASIMTSPSALESVVSSDETEVKGRGSIPSICTVDTAAMSDDISCGSMSVRSGPPRQQQQQPVSRGSTKNGKPSSNNSRGGKPSNIKSNRVQKQPKANGKAIQSATYTRADGGKAAQPLETAHSNSEARLESSNKKVFGQKQNRGGKGRAGNNQSPRGGRGKGGRSQKAQKNQNSTSRTQSPLPTSVNNSILAATPTKSDHTVISTSTCTTDFSSLTGNGNNNRLPPVSPYSQSLFSCEVGNSGWSLPSLPSTTSQNIKPNFAATTQTSPALSYQTNSFVEPYSRLPPNLGINSGASADLNCGLWNTGNQANVSTFNNIQTTPQRPLRAPPGLPAPPATMTTPIKTSTCDLYTPISTPVNNNTAPSLVPITPSFGTPNVGQQVLPYSWSGMGENPGSSMDTGNGGRRNLVKENPFAVESDNAGNADDAECRIEAELQELGGRMIGSILDF